MSNRNFQQMLEKKWGEGKFVCVGLDSEFGKIPESAHVITNGTLDITSTVCAFNRAIVKATKDLVCAYKLNSAFYEALGGEAFVAIQRTITDIRSIAPDVVVIFDPKRGDIGNTNLGYVKAAFEFLQAD